MIIPDHNLWVLPMKCCLVMLLCIVSSGCSRSQRDPGIELVNAAALSKQHILDALRNGGDVNQTSTSTFGWTPLIAAIYHHNEEVVDVLLAHGANVNIADASNQTPMLWAIQVWGENTNVIVKLLQNGADPRLRNNFGTDAFDMSRQQKNGARIVEILRRFEEQMGKETEGAVESE